MPEQVFPAEIYEEIFRCLTKTQLSKCMRVYKFWKEIAIPIEVRLTGERNIGHFKKNFVYEAFTGSMVEVMAGIYKYGKYGKVFDIRRDHASVGYGTGKDPHECIELEIEEFIWLVEQMPNLKTLKLGASCCV